jgi:hypothetical protein
VEGVCGHIKRHALAALRLGEGPENHIDFEMFQSMERLRNEMKGTVEFADVSRCTVMHGKLAGQVRGKNSMDCPSMHVICCPVAMIGFGMDVDPGYNEHPQGHPRKKQEAGTR